MASILKWAVYVLLGVAIPVLAASIVAIFVLWNSVPEKSGVERVAGLKTQVEVVVDKNAIPHITAPDQAEALFVLGYFHARDRLWQMEMLRRAGEARLSELFGKETLETDIFLRTLDIAGSARKSYEVLKPETKALLTAYANGVNAWLIRDLGMFEPRLPPEFLILRSDFEPWEPHDPVMLIKIMALTLGQNHGKEIERLAMASYGLSPTDISELLPAGPRDNPPLLPDLRELYGFGALGKKRRELNSQLSPLQKHAELAWPIGVNASNNWVVSGSRTDTGKPILANDPHLGLNAPSLFYLAHLAFQDQGEPVNIIGGTLPGTPLVLVGRNDRIAWGLTTTGLDTQDLYLERQVINEPDKYFTPTGIQTIEEEEVTIKVKGEPDHRLKIRSTRNGPVLPGSYRSLSDLLPERHLLSMKWVALAEDDTTLDGVISLPLGKSVEEFMANLSGHVAPMQSIVIADVDGNTGLIAPGRIPKRKPENRIMGRAPSPGWLADYDWEGYLDFSEVPKFINPPGGAMATANANFLPPQYKSFITFDWAEHYRQARVEELVLDRSSKETIASSVETISDTYSDALFRMRDAAVPLVASGVGVETAILSALGDWNGEMDGERPEPLIMMAWFKHLHKAAIEDDLGDAYPLFQRRARMAGLLRIIQPNADRDWCDDQRTASTETCSQIAGSSLAQAIDELKSEHGQDWRQWKWGTAHIALNEHQPFGSVGALKRFFNIETPSDGGPYTLRRGQNRFDKDDNPYASRHGSAYRAIYDFSDLNQSQFIISTGQSGHFMSPHYADQSARWADMQFIKMSTDPKDYKTPEAGVLTLEPKELN